MGDKKQEMSLGAQLEQDHPQKRSLCQIKGQIAFCLHYTTRFGFPFFFGDMLQVAHRERKGEVRSNRLGEVLLFKGKGGTENLVTLHQFIETLFQSLLM